jgi:hypothetical protein
MAPPATRLLEYGDVELPVRSWSMLTTVGGLGPDWNTTPPYRHTLTARADVPGETTNEFIAWLADMRRRLLRPRLPLRCAEGNAVLFAVQAPDMLNGPLPVSLEVREGPHADAPWRAEYRVDFHLPHNDIRLWGED